MFKENTVSLKGLEAYLWSMSKKKHTTVTIDIEIIKWIKEQIEKKRFSSISHGLEWCVYQIMEKEREEEKEG